MIQTHTFISHTQRILFLYPSVAKVANNRVGRGESRVPPQMFSPPLFGPIRQCHNLPPQSARYRRSSPHVATASSLRYLCYFDLIASQGFVCEFHHAYNTDGDGIWFVRVQSWINAFLILITYVNIEISLNKHQQPALSRVILKVMDHSWNRSAALTFLSPPILSK